MTRETKVGLLIGVGVILLIGIILSDYLSEAQRQQPAQMEQFAPRAQAGLAGDGDAALPPEPVPAVDALAGRRAVPLPDELDSGAGAGSEPRMIDAPTSRGPSEMTRATELIRAWNTVERPQPGNRGSADQLTTPVEGQALANTPVEVEVQPREMLVDRGSGNTRPLNPGRGGLTVDTEPIVHYVKPGETLYTIAQRYYGNGEYYRSIIEANPGRVLANGHVREDVRLVIPNKAGLIQAAGQGASPETNGSQQVVTADVIVVQSGQTLSSLAQRYLGSSSRWRDLFDANRDLIDSPRELAPGMKLKIPVTSREQPANQSAVYVVRSGDSLSGIANRVFGDRERWNEIYQANRDVLKDPDALAVGTRLKLPASE